MHSHLRAPCLALLALLAIATSCGDGTGPGTPVVHQLDVSGVRIDAAEFRTSGEFALGLLATDANGQSILATGVGIVATLLEVGQLDVEEFTLTFRRVTAETPSSAPTHAAILLDNSGSMSANDPARLRSAAARMFWQAVLPARSTNQVALLDFGTTPTSPFAVTRLLQTWTRDVDVLEARLASVGAFGLTPLYESLEETSGWMTSTVPAPANRVILLLSDGAPSSTARRDPSIAAARSAAITVHTVGLGPASDLSPNGAANAIAEVRRVAERTGGVYAAATGADALLPIFQTLARVSSLGQLVAALQIAPVPATGTRISGMVTVTSGGSTRTASWSFLAP